MSEETQLFETKKETEPEVQIDTPLNLRPDLSQYGIEETDRGICVDSFENRQALRRARMNWMVVYAVNGVPTGLIQALSPEMQTQQRLMSIDEKAPILVDHKDRNSDYLTGFDLLAESAADYIVPPWVLSSTKVWVREQNEGGPKPTRKPSPLPSRCKAIKDDGVRCQLWTGGRINDDGLCRVHISSLRNKPTDSVERARNRLTQATPAAVDILETLMDGAESEQVKLKAATEILDRAGVRGGVDIHSEVTVDVRPAASIVAERLQRLSTTAKEISATQEAEEAKTIDAEIVEEVEVEDVAEAEAEDTNRE